VDWTDGSRCRRRFLAATGAKANQVATGANAVPVQPALDAAEPGVSEAARRAARDEAAKRAWGLRPDSVAAGPAEEAAAGEADEAAVAPEAAPGGAAAAASESDDAWMYKPGVLGACDSGQGAQNPENPKGGGKAMRRGRGNRDWLCGSCEDYRNFARREVCNMCGRPRAEVEAKAGGDRKEEGTIDEAENPKTPVGGPKRRRWRSRSS